MSKKKKHIASIGARISRVKRRLDRYESMIRKGEYLTAAERHGYSRAEKLLRRLLMRQSATNRKKNPQKQSHGALPVFRSVRQLPAGRFMLMKKKGSKRFSIFKVGARRKK